MGVAKQSARLRKALEVVRAWKHRIGTKVLYHGDGQVHRTESHAGLIHWYKDPDTPGLFVSGIETPVPLGALEVVKRGTGRGVSPPS